MPHCVCAAAVQAVDSSYKNILGKARRPAGILNDGIQCADV